MLYSVSVRRLVCLAYEALREVTDAGASPHATAVMCAAIRDLFELFCDIVPFYHRQHVTSTSLHAGSSSSSSRSRSRSSSTTSTSFFETQCIFVYF